MPARSTLTSWLAIASVGLLVSACTASTSTPIPASLAPTASQPSASPRPQTTVPSASAPASSPSMQTPRPTAGGSTWIVTGSLGTPRRGHTATLLADGRVLVVGGTGAAGSYVTDAEIYDPGSGSWVPAGSLAVGRTGHTATLLGDGTVLVAGGWTDRDDPLPATSTERLDSRSGTWVAAARLHDPRASHTATVLADGSLLVTGGSSYNGGNGAPQASVEVLRPGASAWTTSEPMLESRAAHTATILADGSLLVVGGAGSETEEVAPVNTMLRTAEIRDPTTGTWSTTGSVDDGRAGHTATLLADGTVLVSRMGREGTAVVYEPTTGTFAPTNDMERVRFRSGTTMLRSGEVLVVGGEGFDDPDTGRTAELYDPGTGSWSSTASMAGPRISHTVTRVSDGVVLVVGGQDARGELVTLSELYRPAGS